MTNKLYILCLALFATAIAFAEFRLTPYTPDQLYEMSSLVFTGTVLEIESVDAGDRKFPVRAKVDKILKGKSNEAELTFRHKHPALHAIFKEEFNTPSVGQEGTFFFEVQNGTLQLIGYIKKDRTSG